MKLCVDSRERLKIEPFRKYIADRKSSVIDGIEVVTSQVGDVYTPDGCIGIERKATDFVNDIFNGKLEQQMHELKNNFERPYLFIEYNGLMDLIENNLQVNPSVIEGELAAILARHKVTVCFVGGHYIPLVVRLVEKFYDLHNPTKNINYVPIRRKATTGEIRLDLISRLPKVGAKKGNKLLEKFDNSIQKISNASIEELMEVDGIGEKMAKQIKEILK